MKNTDTAPDIFVEAPPTGDVVRDQGRIDQLIAYTKQENPPLTPEVMKGAEELDQIGADKRQISKNAVVGAVGVFAGIKPTAIMRRTEIKDPSQFLATVSEMNLKAVEFVNPISGYNQDIVLSRYEELASALRDEFLCPTGEFRQEDRQHRIGALLGFPETAVNYYIKRSAQVERTGIYPPMVDHGGKEVFTQFILSPDHYEQELGEYSHPLEEAVRVVLPRTYDRIEKMAEWFA